MKISLDELLNNWEYWVRKRYIMGEDVYIELNGSKYELSGIHKRTNTISFVHEDKIYTIPLPIVKYIIVEGLEENA